MNRILLAMVFLLAALPAQMEKRLLDRYAASEFARQAPAVGEIAPDLRLWDLRGRPRSLALERGRTLVLIGGSYT
ncbi:MAG: hypothetical protein IPK26_11340 [Planctomycetes bacterium]|nr:hypothetical protein [Planctomycetota bacterium]